MTPKILITGIPGVGKTTLSNHTLMVDSGFKYFHIGAEMHNLGVTRGIIKDSFDLNGLPAEKRKQLQNAVVESMDDGQKGKGLIVDGHLIVDSNFGFIPGIEFETFNKCGFTAIIVVRSKIEDVLRQRDKDENKYRKGSPTIEHLTLYQDLIINSALLYSLQFYIGLHFIENVYDNVDKPAKEILSIMMHISNGNINEDLHPKQAINKD